MRNTQQKEEPLLTSRNKAPVGLEDILIHAEEAAKLLRSLANANRLMLLCCLTAGEMSVGALNECIPLSQSALSQHLAVLREEGLVNTRRENQTIFYSIPQGAALQILEVLHSLYCSGNDNIKQGLHLL